MLPIEFEKMLIDAYHSIGAFETDIAYVYTDFRHFGISASGCENRNEFCRAIIKPFPDYVRGLFLPIESVTRGSLTPLVKEKFPRAFLFAHNPWHQDTVDYPESDNLSYTTLLSLTHRSGEQAPLLFCPESSVLGEVPFPLDYRIEGETMLYRNDKGNFKLKVDRANLEPGDLFAWHSYNFHSVQPCFAEDPAMALRFTFAPSFCNNGIRDKRNIREAGRSLLSRFTALGGKNIDHIRENS